MTRKNIALGLMLLFGCGGSETSQTDGGAGGGGGAAGSGGAGGSAGSGGLPDAGGVDSGEACENCGPYRSCCDGRCVNVDNDPMNCGQCGIQCGADKPFCEGTCKEAPCSRDAGSCGAETCCGDQCCTSGDLCCAVMGPIEGAPICFTPTADQPTCPQGCAPLCISDRNLKREVAAVDRQSVLEAVSRMPISTWAYKTDAPGVRHLGPMAQDFRAAFALGDSDRTYNSIDAHGVALASIQALYQLATAQNRRIEQLERENTELRQRMDRLDR